MSNQISFLIQTAVCVLWAASAAAFAVQTKRAVCAWWAVTYGAERQRHCPRCGRERQSDPRHCHGCVLEREIASATRRQRQRLMRVK